MQSRLKSGDLIFVEAGDSDFSAAISDATAQSDSTKVVHVGIIYMDATGRPKVIEAVPEKGVAITDLGSFIDEVPKTQDSIPRIALKRLNMDLPTEEIISRALNYLGQEYDWWYLPDNGRMYCSELVYEAFIDKHGNHVFPASPMNFRDKDGELPVFWVKLFESLGMGVPEGVGGTNPQDIYNDPRLQTIDLIDIFQ